MGPHGRGTTSRRAISASPETNLLTEQTIDEFTMKSPTKFIRDPQGVIVSSGVLTWLYLAAGGNFASDAVLRSLDGVRPGFWFGFAGPEKTTLQALFSGTLWHVELRTDWDDPSTTNRLAQRPVSPDRRAGGRIPPSRSNSHAH